MFAASLQFMTNGNALWPRRGHRRSRNCSPGLVQWHSLFGRVWGRGAYIELLAQPAVQQARRAHCVLIDAGRALFCCAAAMLHPVPCMHTAHLERSLLPKKSGGHRHPVRKVCVATSTPVAVVTCLHVVHCRRSTLPGM